MAKLRKMSKVEGKIAAVKQYSIFIIIEKNTNRLFEKNFFENSFEL
jgi:hypothetical protein